MENSSAPNFNLVSRSSLTTYLAISAVKTASGRGILARKICNSRKSGRTCGWLKTNFLIIICRKIIKAKEFPKYKFEIKGYGENFL